MEQSLTEQSLLEQLPFEVQIIVLTALSPEEIRSMSATNRYWYDLINSEHATKTVIKNLALGLDLPIHTACLLRTKGALEWLKKQDKGEIDLNYSLAVSFKRNDVVSFLINKKLAGVNAKDDSGYIALDKAAVIAPNPTLVSLLLKEGADPEVSGYGGQGGLLETVKTWIKLTTDNEQRKKYQDIADLIQYREMASLFDEKISLVDN